MIGYIKTASEAISKVPGLSKIMDLVSRSNPILESLRLLNKLGSEARETAAQTGTTASALAHLAELQAKYAAATLGAKRKLTAEELKALKAAKLKAALEKANLALNKGQEIFDMDKIQNAAALANQAEILGRSTTASQAMQIANDTARLNLKKSISELEDAIAKKDEEAITAATKRLNEDVKIFNALSGQNIKLSDIKSILETLKPTDLINLANLDAAIAKMMELLRLQGTKTLVPKAGTTAENPITPPSIATPPAATLVKPSYTNTPFAEGGMFNLEDVARSSLLAGLSGGAGVAGAVSGSRYAAQAANQYNITVQAGIGDPNAIAEAIDNVLREAQQRGTLTIA
jgi:hypothetical protein